MNLIFYQFGRPKTAAIFVVSDCVMSLLAEVYQGLLD